jgi:hypothetical protein
VHNPPVNEAIIKHRRKLLIALGATAAIPRAALAQAKNPPVVIG